MKNLFLAAMLSLLGACGIEDESRVTWLADHAARIRSIDPADDDFSDLEPLRATLAGVRVVMLGEQSHGDGSTFLAKTRLIRFLHEKMGYDVLAFESGLYDCAKAWELLARGEEPREAVSRGVFRIWTISREVQPLIDYLGSRAKTARPLEVAGVDSQFTGSASRDFLVADLAAFLSSIDPKLAAGDDWNRVVQVIGHLATSSWERGVEPVPSSNDQAAFVRTIEQWRSAIAACDAPPPSRGASSAARAWSGAFWRQLLASLRVFAEQTWRTDYSDHAGDAAVSAMRDLQMGKNLVWLAKERYPDRKIIVWAATFHNARELRTIEVGDTKYARLYRAMSPMGEVAWRELGRELYSLGFTSYQGETATAFARNAHSIPPPSAGSLEDLFARAGLETALVDFRNSPRWLRAPMIARLLGHKEMRADWTRIVDGVVFLRTMTRSHRSPRGTQEPP